MTVRNTDFGQVADDLRRAASSFALLTTNATAFGVALNSFREFQKQLIATNAVAQGTAENYAQMEAAARRFALATTTSATEAVNALQNLAQAGFTAQESLQAMTGVLLLASATLTDVGTAADLISSNIRAFNLEATETTRVSNLFVAAITSGLASIDKLTFAMRQVAPVADVANLSIEETTAFLNELFNVGLRGEQAGTALRNVIVRLVRPTGEAAKILREIGVATVDATGNFRDLESVLQEIAAANLGEAQLAKIFENEALAGAITLLKSVSNSVDGTTSSYRKMLAEISGTQDALILTLKNLESFDAQMLLLRNSVIDLAITIGEELAPYIEAIAEYVRELINAFRELDPETRALYTQLLLVGAAILGLLGTINALILLFGTAGVTALRFGVALGGLPLAAFVAGIGGMVGGLDGAVIAFAAVLASMKILRAYMAGTLLVAIRGAALALGLFALTNPVVAGIAAVGAAIAAVTTAFTLLRGESEETRESLKKLEDIKVSVGLEFDRQASSLGIGEFGLLQLQDQGDLARQLADSDLVRAVSDNDFITGIQAAQESIRIANTTLEEAERGLSALNETWAGVRKARETYNEGLAELQDSWYGQLNDSFFRFIPLVGSGDTVEGLLRDAITEQNPEALALLEEFGGREDLLVAEIEKNKETVRIAREGRETAVRDLLQSIATGEAELPTIYADLAEGFRGYLQTANKEQIDAIVAGLTAEGTEFTQEALISALLTAQGVDPGFISEILLRQEKERVRKVVADLQSIADELAAENEQARIAALEYTAKNSENLTEALRAGLEAANAQLELDLQESLEDFATKYGEQLTIIINQNQEGIQEAIDAAVADSGFDISASDGIEEILGGSALIDALNERIDEDTSPEEIMRIAAEEGAKYAALLEEILIAVAEASGGAISEEQLDQLRAIVAGRVEAIGRAAVEGAQQGADSQEAVRERIERSGRDADRAADKALKEARKALKKAREIEDLFRDATEQGREAQARYIEAVRGLDIDQRIAVSLDFELEEINEDFDNQILEIQRKLQDLELDFSGTPEELEKIKTAYSGVIAEIERARDAEIAAASSFTAQMERRGKAIDLFIRDLRDIAIATKDTFTQVGAGIATAFAEYQKDLVTLIDITKDATTGLLDTITTGIGDFIFDNENAWENFKKNILNISRQIFEGFTKALLQQAISSLTGGPGSILGNALQPSPYGSTGTPSVGTGGLLGRLFPGLSGAMGGANAAAVGGASDSVAQVLTGAAARTDAAYTTHLSAMQTTFTQFETGMRGALNSVVTAIQGMASQIGAGGAGGVGAIAGAIGVPGVGSAATGAIGSAVSAAYTAGSSVLDGMVTSLQDGIVETAAALKINPIDLATVISYETGGTFNPLQRGPTTQWGQHRGLIQFGEPQAAMFGVDFSSEMAALQSQLGPNGAIVKYLEASGFQPGMGILDLYSTINAGAPGRYGASDANNGGAPGTVLDKVNNQMAGHLANAEQLFADFNTDLSGVVTDAQGLFDQFGQAVTGPVQAGTQYFDANGNPLSPQALAGIVQPQPMPPTPAPLPTAVGALTGQPGAGVPGLPGQGGGVDQIMQIASQLTQTMTQFVQSITQTLNQFGQQFTQALNSALQQMGAPGGLSFAGVGGGAGSGIGGGGGGLGGLFGLLGGLFAEGGYTGDGGKYEPAGVVHKGEFVTNAQATKDFLPLLQMINDGTISLDMIKSIGRKPMDGYAMGGLVGGSALFGAGFRFETAALDALGYDNRSAQGTMGNMPGLTRQGDNIALNVTYNITGNQSPDRFARSANQHAKVLMGRIERAKRNT